MTKLAAAMTHFFDGCFQSLMSPDMARMLVEAVGIEADCPVDSVINHELGSLTDDFVETVIEI